MNRRPSRAVFEQRRAQIIEMTQRGMTMVQIAAELDVSVRTVTRHRRAGNAARHLPHEPEAVAERRARVVELTAAGLNSTEIATRLRITARSVQRHRRAAGVSGRAAPYMTEDEARTARTMLEDGASYHEVARTLKRSYETIRNRWPGFTWDKSKAAQAGALSRWMTRLERTPNVATKQKGRAA